MRKIILLFALGILISCNSSTNSEEFMNKTEGRYLFNADEIIKISFKEAILHLNWRGTESTPLKVNDSTFYVKSLNEKIVFVLGSETFIKLAPKKEHEGKLYHFTKLKGNKKTGWEYFEEKDYENALKAYIEVKERDSLDPVIQEWRLNRLGYKFLNEKKFEEAKAIFNINISLYPHKSNVYDSMADAYAREDDVENAMKFYNLALKINPENRRALRYIEEQKKKKDE